MIPRAIGPGAFAIALTLYVTFSFASVVGASTAVNETRAYAEVHHDVDSVVDEAHAEVDANLTGNERVVEPVYDWVFSAADSAVEAGFDFGYDHPAIAEAHAKAVPVFAVIGLAGFVVYQIRRLRP